MKFIKLVLCFICMSVYAFGNDRLARLHGTVLHQAGDSIIFSYAPTDVVYKLVTYPVPLSKTGTFNIELPLRDKFTIVRVEYGDQETEFAAEPGIDLNLTVDAKKFDSTLHYNGKGDVIANFTGKHVLEIGTLLSYNDQLQSLFADDPEKFENGLNKLDTVDYNFLAAK